MAPGHCGLGAGVMLDNGAIKILRRREEGQHTNDNEVCTLLPPQRRIPRLYDLLPVPDSAVSIVLMS